MCFILTFLFHVSQNILLIFLRISLLNMIIIFFLSRRECVQETGEQRMRLKALKWNTVLPQAIRDAAAEELNNMPKYR